MTLIDPQSIKERVTLKDMTFACLILSSTWLLISTMMTLDWLTRMYQVLHVWRNKNLYLFCFLIKAYLYDFNDFYQVSFREGLILWFPTTNEFKMFVYQGDPNMYNFAKSGIYHIHFLQMTMCKTTLGHQLQFNRTGDRWPEPVLHYHVPGTISERSTAIEPTNWYRYQPFKA